MITKYAGLAIIFVSSVAWGAYMGSKDYFRLTDLRNMKRAFLLLRSEIDYGMSQLKDAAMSVCEKCPEPVSKIFSDFSHGLEKKEMAVESWAKAIDKNASDLYFLPEDTLSFKTFGKALGYMDKDMQLANIDMQLDYIHIRLEALEAQYPASKKMYLSLGTLLGLVIVILAI